MDASQEVAANIRAALGRNSMTKVDLARRMGATEMWVNRRLNDRTPITVDDLASFAAALGIPANELMPAEAAS